MQCPILAVGAQLRLQRMHHFILGPLRSLLLLNPDGQLRQPLLCPTDRLLRTGQPLRGYVLLRPRNIILVALVQGDISLGLLLPAPDQLQLRDTAAHILQHALQLLIAPDILPKRINIDLPFIQNIGIDKFLDIPDRLKGHGLRNQGKKLLIQTSEARQNHGPGLRQRRCPFPYALVGAEGLNAPDPAAVKEQLIGQLPVLHEIPGRIRLLFFRLGVHDNADQKTFILRFVKKLQADMCRKLTRTLIRTIFLSGLAANIAVQIPPALFIGCLIKVRLGTGHRKLYGVQHRGLAGGILTGQQGCPSELDGLIRKAVPVDQPNPFQYLHLNYSLFCIYSAAH